MKFSQTVLCMEIYVHATPAPKYIRSQIVLFYVWIKWAIPSYLSILFIQNFLYVYVSIHFQINNHFFSDWNE